MNQPLLFRLAAKAKPNYNKKQGRPLSVERARRADLNSAPVTLAFCSTNSLKKNVNLIIRTV